MTRLILLGGGIDSITLLVELALQGEDLHAIFFDYGQKANDEEFISCDYFCEKYGIPLKVVQVGIGEIASCSILKNSPVGLTPSQNILEGRNAIFLSLAVTYSCLIGAREILVGFHKEPEGSEFEDAKQLFIEAFNNYVDSYLRDEYKGVRVVCPYKELTRQKIFNRAMEIDEEIMKYSHTCYEGGIKECGVCVHCKQKAEMKEEWKNEKKSGMSGKWRNRHVGVAEEAGQRWI